MVHTFLVAHLIKYPHCDNNPSAGDTLLVAEGNLIKYLLFNPFDRGPPGSIVACQSHYKCVCSDYMYRKSGVSPFRDEI